MARLRLLIAALLLVAFTLGVPTHAATTHGLTHAGGPAVAHVHDHGRGKGKCCPDGHKLASHEACQIACDAALAMLEGPAELITQLAYAVQFASGPPDSVQEAVPVPDPFPPRPSHIA